MPENQPINDKPMGLGFHTVGGSVDQGGHRYRPRVVGAV